jgi:2-keto-3-deoxy-L-rhamnonate aldolase RhmA
MNIGRPGERSHPDIRAVERRVIESSLKAGVQPRAEIHHPDQAKYYLDMGVRHFSLGVDLTILFNWWKENGETMRKTLEGERS